MNRRFFRVFVFALCALALMFPCGCNDQSGAPSPSAGGDVCLTGTLTYGDDGYRAVIRRTAADGFCLSLTGGSFPGGVLFLYRDGVWSISTGDGTFDVTVSDTSLPARMLLFTRLTDGDLIRRTNEAGGIKCTYERHGITFCASYDANGALAGFETDNIKFACG